QRFEASALPTRQASEQERANQRDRDRRGEDERLPAPRSSIEGGGAIGIHSEVAAETHDGPRRPSETLRTLPASARPRGALGELTHQRLVMRQLGQRRERVPCWRRRPGKLLFRERLDEGLEPGVVVQ